MLFALHKFMVKMTLLCDEITHLVNELTKITLVPRLKATAWGLPATWQPHGSRQATYRELGAWQLT